MAILTTTHNGLNFTGGTTYIQTGTTTLMSIAVDGSIAFNEYGAGYLKTDASGNITADNTAGGLPGGPYLPLSAGSGNGLTGQLWFTGTTDANRKIFFTNAGTYAKGLMDAASYAFQVSGSEKLTIASTGNVGIGTTSPSAKIHAFSPNTISRTTTTDIIKLGSNHTDIGYDGFGTAIVDFRRTYQESAPHAINRIKFIERGDSTKDFGGAIQFETKSLSSGTAAPVTRMTIDYTGNVGIGTTSPANRLEIVGPYASTPLKVLRHGDYGNVINMGRNGVSETANIGYPADSTINLSTSGSERMRITSAGNVGIGTTSPETKLEVTDTIQTTKQTRSKGWYTSGSGLALETGVSGGKGYVLSYNRTTSSYADTIIESTGVKFVTASSGKFYFTGGNVGIGTTSPVFKLQTNATITGNWLGYLNGTTATFGTNNFSAVHNSTAIGTGTESGINLANNASDDGAPSPIISFSAKSASASFQHAYAAIYGIKTATGADANWNKGDLVLATGQSTGPLERMRIDSVGNVGIGTTNPAQKFVVADSTNGDGIELVPGSTSVIQAFDRTASLYNNLNIDTASTRLRSTDNIEFKTGSGFSEAMRIDSSGNVGIGTTSPSAKLEIGSAYGDAIILKDNRTSTSGEFEHGIRFSHYNNYANGLYFQHNDYFGITKDKFLLKVGNGTKMVVDHSGNVGIGTTSPGEKLHVFGGAAAIKIDSTTNEASLKYDNSTTTAAIKLANNDLKTELGGSERMRILANGNVGIGTTSPDSKLDVKGPSAVPADGNQTLSITNTTGGTQLNLGTAENAYGWIEAREGNTSRNLLINPNGSNVGIGLINPAKTLDVFGTGRFYDDLTLSENLRMDNRQTGVVSSPQPRISRAVLESSIETGNAVVHPYFNNDLANFVARGGTITVGGVTTQPGSEAKNVMFQPSNQFMVVSGITGSTWSITLLSAGDASFNLTYGCYIGITFGSGSFDPDSMIIEGTTDATGATGWTTALNSSVSSTTYSTYLSSGGTGIKAIRFTMGYTSGSPRVNNIFAYNYASKGMTNYFLGKHGGKVYGNIETTSFGSSAAVNLINNSGSSYFNGGNVGIGTTSPSEKLSVSGNILAQDSGVLAGINGDKDGFIFHDLYTGSGNYYGYKAFSGGNTRLSIVTDASERLTVLAGGNVGIGTTAPGAKLNIYHSFTKTAANPNTVEVFHNGSVSTNNIYPVAGLFTQRVSGGSNSYATGLVGVADKQGDYGYIARGVQGIGKLSGNVSVNNADMQYMGVEGRIEMEGSNSVNLDDRGYSFYGTAEVDSGSHLKEYHGLYLSTPTNNGTILNKYGVSQVDANSRNYFAGNVGIGTNSPDAKLDVNGTSLFRRDLTIYNKGNNSSPSYELRFKGTNSSGVDKVHASLESSPYATDTNAGTLLFKTANASNQILDTRMVIDGVGNVGIGTTSPSEKLDVVGGSLNVSDTYGTVKIIGTGGLSRVFLGDTADEDVGYLEYNHISNYFKIGVNAAERMRITSTGNVGIGTTNPGSYKLKVAGVSDTQGLVVGYQDLLLYDNNTYSPEFKMTNNTHSLGIDYQNNETLRWITRSGVTTVPITFQMRAGTITATNFIFSSDERKKTKIADLSCDNIDVSWKSFEMKDNEGEYRTGVVAQELEQKHPEFVNTNDEGFKSVKYIDLLIAKIAELEARLEKLEK